MPAGAEWQGIYQGPYHSYLRIVVHGSEAEGTWRAPGNRSGEFSGVITGNVLRLEWSEQAEQQQAWSGRGYFVYQKSAKGVDEISGQWGLDGREEGNQWWAVKRTDLPLDAGAEVLVENGARGDSDADEPATTCVTCDDEFNSN